MQTNSEVPTETQAGCWKWGGNDEFKILQRYVSNDTGKKWHLRLYSWFEFGSLV